MSSSLQSELPREALVDKLQDALAAFRKERDELHRKKALAEERLRLMQEERVALERTVAGMQTKLEKLQASGSEDALQELKDMEMEVTHLQKEVKYQHTELVTKRNKVDGIQKQYEEDCVQRNSILMRYKQVERKRRLQLASATTSTTKHQHLPSLKLGSTNNNKRNTKLQQELAQEIDTDLLRSRLPRWIDTSTTQLKTEAESVHAENERLSKVLLGYKKRLDRSLANGPTVMEQ